MLDTTFPKPKSAAGLLIIKSKKRKNTKPLQVSLSLKYKLETAHFRLNNRNHQQVQ